MSNRNNGGGGIDGCGVIVLVLLVLWVLGYFADKPRAVTIPEVHGAVGGGLAVVVAGGWNK